MSTFTKKKIPIETAASIAAVARAQVTSPLRRWTGRLAPAKTRGVRWVAQKLFESAGFSWDLRRSGELKIGMWRKSLRSRFAGKAVSPKRFVLTPGFGDSPISWLLVAQMLMPAMKRAGFDEIVMLDFPGFSGRLSDERCVPTMDLLLSTTADVFDWLEPDTILGHSLGGWVSAHYAIECGAGRRPAVRKRHGYEGPRKLLLAASAGVYESQEVQNAIGAIFSDAFGEKGFASLRPHLFAREPKWFDWFAKDFSKFVSDTGIHQFVASMREEHLLKPRLGEVRAQTWLLWGDRDTLVPVSGMSSWLRGLESASGVPHAVLIRDVGHSLQVEKPAVVAAALSQILLGRAPKGRGLSEVAG
jgi:pimeloyl-ACP methyl ester carboxylesterase